MIMIMDDYYKIMNIVCQSYDDNDEKYVIDLIQILTECQQYPNTYVILFDMIYPILLKHVSYCYDYNVISTYHDQCVILDDDCKVYVDIIMELIHRYFLLKSRTYTGEQLSMICSEIGVFERVLCNNMDLYMYEACMYNNVDALKFMVSSYGIKYLLKNNNDYFIITDAILNNRMDVVFTMLDYGCKLDNACFSCICTEYDIETFDTIFLYNLSNVNIEEHYMYMCKHGEDSNGYADVLYKIERMITMIDDMNVITNGIMILQDRDIEGIDDFVSHILLTY